MQNLTLSVQAVSTCHLWLFFSCWMRAGTSMSRCSRPITCSNTRHHMQRTVMLNDYSTTHCLTVTVTPLYC
jgi:hypothetical protein